MGEERQGGLLGRQGVLAAGPPGLPGDSSALVSSTVSRLSCKERSAGVESSTESSTEASAGSEVSPGGGGGLWRVTPSSPVMASTLRLHMRPKYVRETAFPGKTMFPTGQRTEKTTVPSYVQVVQYVCVDAGSLIRLFFHPEFCSDSNFHFKDTLQMLKLLYPTISERSL